MSSRREQLVLAVVAQLNAVAKPAGLEVTRARLRPLTVDDCPAAVVYLLEEQVVDRDGRDGYKSRRNCTLCVELRAWVPGGESPDAAVDPLVSWAVQAVLQGDRTFGGLAIAAREMSVTWDAIEREGGVFAAAAVQFVLDYTTAAGDPDAP